MHKNITMYSNTSSDLLFHDLLEYILVCPHVVDVEILRILFSGFKLLG